MVFLKISDSWEKYLHVSLEKEIHGHPQECKLLDAITNAPKEFKVNKGSVVIPGTKFGTSCVESDVERNLLACREQIAQKLPEQGRKEYMNFNR